MSEYEEDFTALVRENARFRALLQTLSDECAIDPDILPPESLLLQEIRDALRDTSK